ncbi:hypothetical protein G7Z17_g8667 [Cylindrodendrum hubeiense]|uniref:Uncharacterized protein n=1 Tax=Cylindrodendrum hubeiense TaxID=595255 RepID=A0A9P5L6B4_9HYPO|nr:hypothetical protein G7Z17_g8667 [Cylindrodendrum hubeiense]
MAGQENTTTLRRLLSQQKPRIPSNVTSSKNSINELWPEFKTAITIWDDFNLANLNESYGHVLDRAVPAHRLQAPLPDKALEGLVIEIPGSVRHLMVWNDDVLRPTLDFAKSHLGLHPGIALRHKYSNTNKTALASIHSEGKKTTVDHLIELDDFPLANLVVGLARPSSKWSSRKLAHQLDSTTKAILWPLRQLAKTCESANTRYGYIQTEEEMVVCCFSKNSNGWKAAIMPIPWTRHGVDTLTTDLALWWLCMLAMSDPQSRAIIEEREMIKINAWDIAYLNEERGWVRRHRYSGFEEPTNPLPPPTYNTPSPGNMAAFEAGVGLNANNDWPDFADPANNLSFLGDFDLDADLTMLYDP